MNKGKGKMPRKIKINFFVHMMVLNADRAEADVNRTIEPGEEDLTFNPNVSDEVAGDAMYFIELN